MWQRNDRTSHIGEGSNRQDNRLGDVDQSDLFRAALDLDEAAVSIFDASSRLQYANPAFCHLYGQPVTDQHLGSTAEKLSLLLVPACGSQIAASRCLVPTELKTGEIEECTVALANGTRIGIVHHVLPTGGWCTRHVREIEQLQRVGAINELISFQSLIDQVHDYLWVKDKSSRFVFANVALAKDHGFSHPSQLVGLTDFDLHCREAAHLFRLTEREILESGVAMLDREEKVVDATAQEKWLSSSKMPLRDASGRIIGIIGVARDITLRRRAEALGQRASELEEASRQLEAALERERQVNALQSQFVAMASHEFRTPLAIIDGAAQRLTRRRDQLDAEFVSTKAEQIRSSVARMVELMESILSFGRLEAGKISIALKPCSIGDILSACCDRHRDWDRKHHVSLRLEPLPKNVAADASALEQVFTNLLSNAAKYSPHSPEIEVRAWSDAQNVYVTVRDRGFGIDEDDLPRMFERYFRARTSSGIAGTGIGLNLVKQIVELHEGTVSVASRKGHGSTFTVSLPAAASAAHPASKAPKTKEQLK
ncbi:UNVERIFIED_ORG: PAS domain S-box-containing protein [Rhizobium esperanzae]